ncbi:unnamed protein product [Arabidopsis thaliana]|uniref:(thale cress) hypothetical protein n=1 Tax=Arabidopsis thaliana TaxID=3702 RepID=A0A7G2EFG5_ARATH|nr:unnamed protein product [Arabidopsis thaliana]
MELQIAGASLNLLCQKEPSPYCLARPVELTNVASRMDIYNLLLTKLPLCAEQVLQAIGEIILISQETISMVSEAETGETKIRMKEIVELFKKVQVQLRARAAAKKEEKKTEEASKGQGGKESETVDSLLKLLRKHSGEQSKKQVSNFNSEKQLQRDDDASERQNHSSSRFDSRNKDHNATPFTRPASSFKRNSPVPRHKSQASYSSEAIFDEASSYSVTWTQKKDQMSYQMMTSLSIPTTEEETAKDEDLSALKLVELRAIAKSRGLKGISKMKKVELVTLLGSSNKA